MLELGVGSVIGGQRGEPVDVVVNGKLVAVANCCDRHENFGVRQPIFLQVKE